MIPRQNTGAAGGVINHSDGGRATRATMMMMTMMEIALLFTDQPWYQRAEIIRQHLPPSFSGMQSSSLVQAEFKMSLSDLPKSHLWGAEGNCDPWTGEFPRRRCVCNQPLSGSLRTHFVASPEALQGWPECLNVERTNRGANRKFQKCSWYGSKLRFANLIKVKNCLKPDLYRL